MYYDGSGDIVTGNNFRFVQKTKQISGNQNKAKIMRNNGDRSMRTGNTANRPVSPSEFEPYHDTDTQSILRYVNGAWF